MQRRSDGRSICSHNAFQHKNVADHRKWPIVEKKLDIGAFGMVIWNRVRPQTVFHLFQTLSSSSEALPTVGSWGDCIGFVIATKYNHTIRRYIQMIVFSVEKNQRWPKTSTNHLPTEIRKSSCIGPDSNKLAN